MEERYIGEVIESSSTNLVAQSRRNEDEIEPYIPPFGGFVKVDAEDIAIYCVICNVIENSIEPNRRATAYNMTRKELYENQPQIFELLKTEFESCIIGYQLKANGHIYQHLPPKPPRIHDFVYECSQEEIKKLTSELDFLRSLLCVTMVTPDELIAACIRHAYQTAHRNEVFLVKAGKEVSRIIPEDYDRLKSIMRRISL